VVVNMSEVKVFDSKQIRGTITPLYLHLSTVLRLQYFTFIIFRTLSNVNERTELNRINEIFYGTRILHSNNCQ